MVTTPSQEALADHPAIVFLAYIAALLPLAVIYACDFIDDKWRTIRETRRKGYFYLVFSIIPLGFIVYYIHLQKVSKDYKEMAAATSAAIFCVFHILRTLWGLLQLHVYKEWNTRALYCLNRIGYECRVIEPISTSPVDTLGPDPDLAIPILFWASTAFRAAHLLRAWVRFLWNRVAYVCVERHSASDLNKSQLECTVDNLMIVNSSLLDNEFRGAAIPCKLNILSLICALWSSLTNKTAFCLCDHLQSAAPEECSVQWMVAFLSMFGAEWLYHKSLAAKTGATSLPFSAEKGIFSLMQTTTYDSERGLRSPFNIVSKAPLSPCAVYQFEGSCSLPFGLKGASRTRYLDFNLYESSIRDGVVSWDRKSLHRLSQSRRDAVQTINAVQLARFSYIMDSIPIDTQLMKPILSQDASKRQNELKQTFTSQVWTFSDESEERLFRSAPLSSLRYLKPLWNGPFQNNLLLQSSVHLDNVESLDCGRRIQSIRKALTTLLLSEDRQLSTFELHRRIEVLSFRTAIAQGHDVQNINRFLGCIAESVRTFLEYWIIGKAEKSGSIFVDWAPAIGKGQVGFCCSDQLLTTLRLNLRHLHQQESRENISNFNEILRLSSTLLYLRILWELQVYLHSSISADIANDGASCNLLGSDALIMLFILGYPSLDIKRDENITEITIAEHLKELRNEFESEIRTLEEEKELNGYYTSCLCIRVTPVEGPQDVYLSVILCLYTGKSYVRLIPSHNREGTFYFHLQDWKDAVMGRILGQSECRSTWMSSKNEILEEDDYRGDLRQGTECLFDTQFRWLGWRPFMYSISTGVRRNLPVNESILQLSEEMEMVRLHSKRLHGRSKHGEILISVADPFKTAKKAQNEGHVSLSIDMYEKCVLDDSNIYALDHLMSIFQDVTLARDHPELESKLFNMLTKEMRKALKDFRTSITIDKISVCFRRMFEKTKEIMYFAWETRCLLEVSASECIRRIEASRISSCPETEYIILLAHFLEFKRTGDGDHLWLAQTVIFNSRTKWRSVFARLYGFLLEKGCISGRECFRLADLCNETVDVNLLDITRHMVVPEGSGSIFPQQRIQRTFRVHKCIRKAAEYYESLLNPNRLPSHDLALVKNRLGLLHMMRKGRNAQLEEAEILLSSAEKYGNVNALCNLGIFYFYFHNNTARALKYFEQALPEDPFRTPLNYMSPLSSPKPHTARSSASPHFPLAQEGLLASESIQANVPEHAVSVNISNLQSNHENVLSANPELVALEEKIYKIWQKPDISLRPHSPAMNNVAVIYESDEDGQNGILRALFLYERILSQDENPVAIYNMAVLFLRGPETFRNPPRGISLLKKLTARKPDLVHMPVFIRNMETLEITSVMSAERPWKRGIEELDDCAVLIKIIDGNEGSD